MSSCVQDLGWCDGQDATLNHDEPFGGICSSCYEGHPRRQKGNKVHTCPNCGKVGKEIDVWEGSTRMRECPLPTEQCRVRQYYPE